MSVLAGTFEEKLVNELERLSPPVSCNGFGPEGPPCTGCPDDETCPILRPVTRAALYLEKL